MHMRWAFQARLISHEYLTAKVDCCVVHTVGDVVFSVIQIISLCNRHDCCCQYSPNCTTIVCITAVANTVDVINAVIIWGRGRRGVLP